MKVLFLYQDVNKFSQKQFLELLPELLKIINNVEIASIVSNENEVSIEQAQFFVQNTKCKFLLVDKSLEKLPYEKVIFKKGMTHKDILKGFGFAGI